MKPNSVMLIEELRELIHEFSQIDVRITKNGDFYKRILYKHMFIHANRWLPVTLSESLRGTNPSHLILFSHNELCNSGMVIQNSWLACELFLKRNGIKSLSRFDSDALSKILHKNKTQYEKFQKIMREVVDYAFF